MTGIIALRCNESSYKTAIYDRYTLLEDVTNYPTKMQYMTGIITSRYNELSYKTAIYDRYNCFKI